MSETIPVYYWDACVFLEYLRKEQVTPGKRLALQKLLRDNKERRNRICTSVITHLECLPKKLTSEDVARENDYRAMFGTRFFYDIEVNAQILILAREIRDFYFAEAVPKTGANHKMMGLGDAIHLATAIIEGIPIFHTRDGRKKGGNVPLLGLPSSSPNGKIAGRYEIEIVSPEEDQGDMIEELINPSRSSHESRE